MGYCRSQHHRIYDVVNILESIGIHSLTFFWKKLAHCTLSELIPYLTQVCLEKARIFTLGKVLSRFLSLYINSRYTLNSSPCCLFCLTIWFLRECFLIFTFVYRKKVWERVLASHICSSSHRVYKASHFPDSVMHIFVFSWFCELLTRFPDSVMHILVFSWFCELLTRVSW